MTRIEEILQKATQAGDARLRYNKRERNAYVLGWIHGAAWADRTMLEKACDWLKENKDKYLYNTGERGEYIPTCSGKMIDEFRNYMKGE